MSIEALIQFFIYLVVIGLIFYVLWWALSQIALPDPFAKVARVLLVLIICVVMVYFLSGLIKGVPHLRLG